MTTMLPCETCHGRCYETMTTGGRLSDWISIACPTCDGTGETPATEAEQAIIDQSVAEFVAMMDREEAQVLMDYADTISAIEAALGIAPRKEVETVPAISVNHPGMDAKWFDAAVQRAMLAGCRVIETGTPGVLFVTSGTSNVTYRVTRSECSCAGSKRHGRCYHRAVAIAYADVWRTSNRRSAATGTAA